MSNEEKEFVTVKFAATLAGTSPALIRKEITDGRIKAEKFDGSWMIDVQLLKEWDASRPVSRQSTRKNLDRFKFSEVLPKCPWCKELHIGLRGTTMSASEEKKLSCELCGALFSVSTVTVYHSKLENKPNIGAPKKPAPGTFRL